MPKNTLLRVLAPMFVMALPAMADTPPPAPDASQAQGPSAADTQAADLITARQQLADAQDKLETSLKSYSILDDENSKLKDKEAAEAAELATLRAKAPLADQAAALHERVRQLQDQVAELAAENAKLRTQLALAAPIPAAPSRPANQSGR